MAEKCRETFLNALVTDVSSLELQDKFDKNAAKILEDLGKMVSIDYAEQVSLANVFRTLLRIELWSERRVLCPHTMCANHSLIDAREILPEEARHQL
jgi:hypothetical protein